MKNSKAFTLAETIITLTIIGVIAVISVSNLINKTIEKGTITKVKRMYSMFSNAYDIAQAEEGTDPSDWVKIYNEPIADIMFKNIKYIKMCKESDLSCESNDIKYKTLIGNNSAEANFNHHKFSGVRRYILEDGTLVFVGQNISDQNAKNCNMNYGTTEELKHVCGAIRVDINGEKNPNQQGIDTFDFLITKHQIIPVGTKEDTDAPISQRCNKNSNNTYNGLACTAWVITKGNMDYKRKSISW